MGVKLNLFCNGQILANEKYLGNMDNINWGPGHVKRDALGIPIKKRKLRREVKSHADISK